MKFIINFIPKTVTLLACYLDYNNLLLTIPKAEAPLLVMA